MFYKNFSIITFVLAAVLMFSACNSNNSKSTTHEETSIDEKKPEESSLRKAPQFEVTTIEGEKISLQQSMEENKPMLIYFTASWCPMCAQNWPALSEVYPEYKDRVNFVAISIDPTDSKEVMTKLANEKGFKFPVVAGNPQVMLDFGVESQATTIGINSNGGVEFQKDKSVLTAQEYRVLLEQLTK